jgi:uncharacterized protein YndB with AHSA1/START domain
MPNPGTPQVTTPSDREIAMTRVFDAPRHLVFEALTKPELLRRWLLGPPGWTMPGCQIDLKVGGAYRYTWRNDENGKEFGTGGVYREILPPERIVNTETMDGQPGEAMVTTSLTEHAGRTTLTLTMLFDSKEIRDGALQSGMEKGVAISYDRLEEMLAASGKGTNVVLLDADVAQAFKDSESVNRALRLLLDLAKHEVPQSR